jgi:hypothetical protein
VTPVSGNAPFVGIRSPMTRPIDPVVGIDAFRRTALSMDRMNEDYFCAGLYALI